MIIKYADWKNAQNQSSYWVILRVFLCWNLFYAENSAMLKILLC